MALASEEAGRDPGALVAAAVDRTAVSRAGRQLLDLILRHPTGLHHRQGHRVVVDLGGGSREGLRRRDQRQVADAAVPVPSQHGSAARCPGGAGATRVSTVLGGPRPRVESTHGSALTWGFEVIHRRVEPSAS